MCDIYLCDFRLNIDKIHHTHYHSGSESSSVSNGSLSPIADLVSTVSTPFSMARMMPALWNPFLAVSVDERMC